MKRKHNGGRANERLLTGYSLKHLQDIKIGDYVQGKELLVQKLKEIDLNIEELGRLCDRKKQRSYEEYSHVLNTNKAIIDDDLSQIRLRLHETYKMKGREELLKKLQKDFTNRKNQVYDTDKEIQNLNKNLCESENKVCQLNEENTFLNQEIKNSSEYSIYLQEKIKELEDSNQNKVNTIAVNNNISNPNINNSLDKEADTIATHIEKLEKYFFRTENMLNQKISHEDKIQKGKYYKYKNLTNFWNPIQDKLKGKIKEHQINNVNLLSEKVSNQEIFFNVSENDANRTKFNYYWKFLEKGFLNGNLFDVIYSFEEGNIIEE